MDEACWTCGAMWSKGAFNADCAECGGGALERNCVACDGECGRPSTRAILDSHDERLAHWIIQCGLPQEEQWRRMMAAAKR